MAKQKSLTDEEIERDVLTEIQEAKKYVEDNISAGRQKAWDRYYGRPLGNETKGRSKFMSRDVLETVEWMLPYLIRQFASSNDDKISLKIEGQPEEVGTALKQKIDNDLDKEEPGRFKLFYQWFKDALVSNTAAVKHRWEQDREKKRHTFEQRLQPEQMQTLMQDPDIEITDYEEAEDGLGFDNVEVAVERTIKDIYAAENVPHWELLVSSRARGVNDEWGKGQKTEVTLDYLKRINRAFSSEGEEPYFRKLSELEEGKGGHTEGSHYPYSGSATLEWEEEAYRNESGVVDEDEYSTGPRQIVDLVEWYDRLDVDGDGYLEDVVVWVANDKMIRWEENEEGIVPFSALSPILDCYQFYGTSWAELVWPIQNLKSMITRQTLDNWEWTNSGRWRVEPSSDVDIRTLMDGVPGDVVRAPQGSVEDISPKPMDMGSSMALLQYADGLKEERSGVSKLSQGKMQGGMSGGGQQAQGQMPDRGIERLMSASQTRINLVARVFAETGLRDFYHKAAKLYQQYLEEPFQVKLYGQDMTIQPQQIQGEITTSVDMAIESAVGMQDAAKLQQTLQFLSGLGEQFPAIFSPEKVYNLAAQYVTSLGWSNPERFLPDRQSFIQEHQKMAQQQQKAQQQQQQTEQQIRERQLRLEELDRQIKLMQAQQSARSDMAKLQQQEAESIRDFIQDERSDTRDFISDLLQLIQDGQTEQVKQILERAKMQQENIKDERDRQERRQQAADSQGRAGRGQSAQSSQNQGLSGQRAQQGVGNLQSTPA